jgi:hypothetical protein
VEQDTLESHILVRGAVRILDAAGGRKAEELGENEEVVVERGVGVRLGLLCKLGDSIRLLLLQLLRQSLLLLSQADPVFLVDLPVLGELLLELEQLRLQGRLLEVGGLLVGVDDLGENKVIERLVVMLGDDGIDLGGVGLRDRGVSIASPAIRKVLGPTLTIFLVMLRMLLQNWVNDAMTSWSCRAYFCKSRI